MPQSGALIAQDEGGELCISDEGFIDKRAAQLALALEYGLIRLQGAANRRPVVSPATTTRALVAQTQREIEQQQKLLEQLHAKLQHKPQVRLTR